MEKMTFSLYRIKKMNNQIEDPFLSLNTSYRVGYDILDYLAMVPLFWARFWYVPPCLI